MKKEAETCSPLLFDFKKIYLNYCIFLTFESNNDII